LGVFASKGGSKLKKVSKLVSNNSTKPVPEGRGDFHFGLLKVSLTVFNPGNTIYIIRLISYRWPTRATLPNSKAMLYAVAFRKVLWKGSITLAYLSKVQQAELALATAALFRRSRLEIRKVT
jgi:hypothetical protein